MWPTAPAGRRKRRKKRHKHRQNRRHDNRKGKHKGNDKGKGKCSGAAQTRQRGRPCCTGLVEDGSGLCVQASGCTPRTCPANGCGSLQDGCGGTLNRGGCTSIQLCRDGACEPCDVCASGCAFTSVQDAIDATPQLETNRICPGTYVENADFRFSLLIERSLTLIGAGDGADDEANTTLRPDHLDQGNMLVAPPLGSPQIIDVVLEQLRITGGIGSNGRGLGVFNTNLTLTRCTITDNHSVTNGGGIFGSAAQIALIDTRVTRNSSGNRGGGIEVQNGSTLTLDAASRVTDNEVPGGGPTSGGGIFNIGATVVLNDVANVTDNDPNDCRGTGSYSGPGAVCTTT